VIRPRLRTLGVHGPGRTFGFRLAPQSEAIEPKRGVGSILSSKEREAELACGQKSSSDRIRGEWSCVDPQTLDHQKRSLAARADVAELSEEPSSNDRQVKVANAFALDQDAASNEIVAGDKRPNHDACAKLAQLRRNTTVRLMNIRHDDELARALKCHPSTVAVGMRSNCAYSSHK
jgi:hypothetical protein